MHISALHVQLCVYECVQSCIKTTKTIQILSLQYREFLGDISYLNHFIILCTPQLAFFTSITHLGAISSKQIAGIRIKSAYIDRCSTIIRALGLQQPENMTKSKWNYNRTLFLHFLFILYVCIHLYWTHFQLFCISCWLFFDRRDLNLRDVASFATACLLTQPGSVAPAIITNFCGAQQTRRMCVINSPWLQSPTDNHHQYHDPYSSRLCDETVSHVGWTNRSNTAYSNRISQLSIFARFETTLRTKYASYGAVELKFNLQIIITSMTHECGMFTNVHKHIQNTVWGSPDIVVAVDDATSWACKYDIYMSAIEKHLLWNIYVNDCIRGCCLIVCRIGSFC